MPRSAISKRPAFFSVAPVNAPFSWPNSSLSISVSVSAAQLTATHGPFARRRRAVDRARDHLLAGAGLAAEQHGRVATGPTRVTNVEHARGGGRAADEVAVGERAVELLLERVGAADQLIARVGADPRGAGEVREAAGGERVGLVPRRRPCDRSTGRRRRRRAPPWIGAAISARPPVSAVTTCLPWTTLSIRSCGTWSWVRRCRSARSPRRPGDAAARRGRQHERAVGAERGQRGIAGGARDRVAARPRPRRAGDRRAGRARRGGGARDRRAPVSASSWRLPTSIVTWLDAARDRDAVDRQVRQLAWRRARSRRRPRARCAVAGSPLISVRGLPLSSIQHSAPSRSSIVPCWRDTVGSVSWTRLPSPRPTPPPRSGSSNSRPASGPSMTTRRASDMPRILPAVVACAA